MKSGALARGARLPPVEQLAARLRMPPETVAQACRDMVDKDELCRLGPSDSPRSMYACSWGDLEDPSFDPPEELGRAVGRFFSYRAEQPLEPLLLKVTRDTVARTPDSRQHGHDFHELVLVTEGAGVHLHRGQRYPVYSGDCFVILPGEKHGYATDSAMTLANVIFYTDILTPHMPLLAELPGFTAFFAVEPLFRDETAFRHKLRLDPAAFRQAAGLVELIEQAQRRKEDGYRVIMLSHFLQLVTHVSRSFARREQQSGKHADLAGKQRVVEQAIAHLERNSTRAVSVTELARSVYLSQSRLQHLFKNTTGMSLTAYLLQVRVDHACSLLRETRLPVTHIAGAVGFHDRGYFTRQFRKRMGVTPLRYRDQSRQGGVSRMA